MSVYITLPATVLSTKMRRDRRPMNSSGKEYNFNVLETKGLPRIFSLVHARKKNIKSF